MLYGEPTVSWPTDPEKFYIRCMYQTFFWGPYDSVEAVRQAKKRMDAVDPDWNYEASVIVKGDVTPEDRRDIAKLEYIRLPSSTDGPTVP